MQEDKTIMKIETSLPQNFDGVFRFTNYSDEDFVGKWGGKEYHYAANTTAPMIIPEHSPLEIQSIRKKFAKDLAEREFFKGNKYETFRLREGAKDDMGMIIPRAHGMSHAGQYSIGDLTPFIQRALEPLPVSQAIVRNQDIVKTESMLSKNDDGELNTGAIKDDKDLEKLAKGTLEQRVFA